ncbi:uncharacterized protein At5g39865-like [Pyrus communis]|uniref:uncharacterized protein At5g39865-like n=1 Tax=Pyrus communis TaxID=23211 RepID=UPI0035C20E69
MRSYHMPFQEPKQKSGMKGMRGKFLKKLKSIPTINTLKHGLLFQLDPAEKFSNPNHQTLSQLVRKNEDCQKKNTLSAELAFKELKDGDTGLGSNVCKENITPPSMETKETVMEDDIFHDAEDDDELPSLLDFEEKCPPGGGDCVVLYSTSVTGVRKTFEDCKAIRFLLESFKVPVYERDLSMHMEFREELWRIFGGRVIPPRLFIKGRYIGGAEEVTALHEQGKLKKLFEGIPIDLSSSPCTGCANVRFVVCFNCNGSRKVFTDGDHENDELCIRCPECNENGLIKCSICC